MPISQTCLKVRDFGRKIKSWVPPPFHGLRTLKHPLFLPPLVALLVKKSGAIAAAHIASREPFKTLMTVRRTVFFVLFVDPWRIEPKVGHDHHLNANHNKLQQCGKICTEKARAHPVKHAESAPADEVVVKRLMWTIAAQRILPLPAVFDHIDYTTDNPLRSLPRAGRCDKVPLGAAAIMRRGPASLLGNHSA